MLVTDRKRRYVHDHLELDASTAFADEQDDRVSRVWIRSDQNGDASDTPIAMCANDGSITYREDAGVFGPVRIVHCDLVVHD